MSRSQLISRSVSPSVYVAYDRLRATEDCYFFYDKTRTRGETYNTTIAYSPESLSMRLCPGPNVALDGVTSEPSFYDSINITPLQYGTVCYMGEYWGNGGFFTSWQDSNPESAIFSLPSDLSLVDPAWGVCTAFTYGALDPPRALIKATAPKGLVPASVLVPSPTPKNQAGPQETIAKPISKLNDPPIQTQLANQSPPLDPPNNPNESADPMDDKDPSNDSPQTTNGNQNSSPDLPTLDAPAGPEGAADPKTSPSSDPTPPNDNHDASPNPSNPDIAFPTQENAQQGDPKLSPNPIQYDPSISQPPSSISVLAIDGHTFTALPSGGYSIADTTIKPDDPGITVQGTPVSLGSSVLVVGSSTVFLPTGSANGVLTAAGVKFTPLGHGKIRLDGEALSVNEPVMTVSGTAVSLASSGIVVAGQTFTFPTLAPEAVTPSAILTIGGQTLTPLGSSKAIINSVTLAINGPAETVSGTLLSLASSGLIING